MVLPCDMMLLLSLWWAFTIISSHPIIHKGLSLKVWYCIREIIVPCMCAQMKKHSLYAWFRRLFLNFLADFLSFKWPFILLGCHCLSRETIVSASFIILIFGVIQICVLGHIIFHYDSKPQKVLLLIMLWNSNWGTECPSVIGLTLYMLLCRITWGLYTCIALCVASEQVQVSQCTSLRK